MLRRSAADGARCVRPGCHMGVTAENVASEYGVSRADQDTAAAESHRRAAAASKARYFKEKITSVEVKGRKGTVTVDTTSTSGPVVGRASKRSSSGPELAAACEAGHS